MEHKIKVLIVEDEALIAENLKFTLEDLGYEVTGTCYSFSEAAAALSNAEADLVMLDINLGSKNSDETGLQLASLVPGGIPFIFLTAYSDVDTIRQATRLKPAGYLIKPVNPATVFAAIQTAIEAVERDTPVPPPTQDEAPGQPDFFFVKVGTRTHKLSWEDVYCIEAGKNYVRLRSTVSKMEYPIRGTLAFVTDQLLPERLKDQFIRVNRSTCLNRKAITSFGADTVYCGSERFESTRLTAKEWQELAVG